MKERKSAADQYREERMGFKERQALEERGRRRKQRGMRGKNKDIEGLHDK